MMRPRTSMTTAMVALAPEASVAMAAGWTLGYSPLFFVLVCIRRSPGICARCQGVHSLHLCLIYILIIILRFC
jgi:hypothetical protein